VRWTYKAHGAVKGAVALANGKLFFGDYSGRVYAIRQADGGEVWNTGTKSGAFGFRSGQFYSTAAVAYGRVFIGNTDGRMYSFASSNGKLAWAKATGGYVYSSPAVAQVPGGKPTVYFGSYSGTFYALDARNGKPLWSFYTGAGIRAAQITYQVNGVQYLTVASGGNLILTFALPDRRERNSTQ
jgi:outer membrane protein assembly factor BamB